MSNFDYVFGHLIPSWFQSFKGNFRIWKDLMTGNYQDYALMWYDDPYEECYEWFWASLSFDDTLPKHFLEHLQQMVNEIETGKLETIPYTEKMIDELIEDLKEREDE